MRLNHRSSRDPRVPERNPNADQKYDDRYARL